MATAITTAGDLIKGTGSGTFDRLGIGSTGQVLTVAAGAPAWVTAAGGGKVLQVVQGTTNTSVTINSTSDTETGLTVSITPSSATSKILILSDLSIRVYRANTQAGATTRLYRDATVIVNGGNGQDNAPKVSATTTGNVVTDMVISIRQGILYLDSPATTSATTYKVTAKSAGTITCQDDASRSNIIALEIGA
jgi:hypothetical protein